MKELDIGLCKIHTPTKSIGYQCELKRDECKTKEPQAWRVCVVVERCGARLRGFDSGLVISNESFTASGFNSAEYCNTLPVHSDANQNSPILFR